MLNYSWSEDYSVGDPVLDSHHKKLLSMFNQLSDVLVNSSLMTLLDVLTDLKDYTIYHFEEEEQRMEASGYPDMEDHVALHEKFIAEVEAAIAKVNDAPTSVTEDMFIFLSSWLINHIQKVDMAYKGRI